MRPMRALVVSRSADKLRAYAFVMKVQLQPR
jgi:hypothetical protein